MESARRPYSVMVMPTIYLSTCVCPVVLYDDGDLCHGSVGLDGFCVLCVFMVSVDFCCLSRVFQCVVVLWLLLLMCEGRMEMDQSGVVVMLVCVLDSSLVFFYIFSDGGRGIGGERI